jgi:hypothetical protein
LSSAGILSRTRGLPSISFPFPLPISICREYPTSTRVSTRRAPVPRAFLPTQPPRISPPSNTSQRHHPTCRLASEAVASAKAPTPPPLLVDLAATLAEQQVRQT